MLGRTRNCVDLNLCLPEMPLAALVLLPMNPIYDYHSTPYSAGHASGVCAVCAALCIDDAEAQKSLNLKSRRSGAAAAAAAAAAVAFAWSLPISIS